MNRSSQPLLIWESEAVKYLDAHPLPVDAADFNKSTGVGERISLCG